MFVLFQANVVQCFQFQSHISQILSISSGCGKAHVLIYYHDMPRNNINAEMFCILWKT
jgi:hypothetical protein